MTYDLGNVRHDHDVVQRAIAPRLVEVVELELLVEHAFAVVLEANLLLFSGLHERVRTTLLQLRYGAWRRKRALEANAVVKANE